MTPDQAKAILDSTFTKSPRTIELRRRIDQARDSSLGVLLLGETGTGKEIVATSLGRQGKQPVAINCDAIPENLLEDELFGHKKGAFTGATTDRVGVFELADQGTLLLDEMGEMPLKLQSKLLRVIQERVVCRLGETDKVRHARCRIIAATFRDLAGECRGGRFRQDLFYRLKGLTIEIPPLRERLEDLEAICKVLLEPPIQPVKWELSPDALRLLKTHSWPGNIRELKSVLEEAILSHNARGSSTPRRIDHKDIELPRSSPYRQQLAAAAIILDRKLGLLLVDSSWKQLFLPSARSPAAGAGNLRTALLNRLASDLDLREGEDYELSDDPIELTFSQPSLRDGENKIYRFRLYCITRIRMSAEQLQKHVFARARCEWLEIPAAAKLDSADLAMINGVPISPTLPRLLLAKSTAGSTLRDQLTSQHTEFGVTVGAVGGVIIRGELAAWETMKNEFARCYFGRLSNETGGNATRAAGIAKIDRRHVSGHFRKLVRDR